MYQAIVFGILSLFLFIYGLMMLRKVWLESKVRPVDLKRLLLVVTVLVCSGGGFFRVFTELSICTCG